MEEVASSGWMLSGAAAMVAIGVGAVLLVAAIALVVWSRGPNERRDRRQSMLDELSYRSTDTYEWTRPTVGASIVFHDAGTPKQRGFRWSVKLPRYNTLTLEVVERTAPDVSPTGGGVFKTEIPELDQRFIVRSPLAAQTMALLTNPRVVKAMMAMPHLSMVLRADELVLHDANRTCLSLSGGEKEMHLAVATLVTAMLTTLYAQSGTLLPEHR